MPKLPSPVRASTPAVPGRTVTTLTPTGGTIPGVLQTTPATPPTCARPRRVCRPTSPPTTSAAWPAPAGAGERVVSVCPYVRAKPGGPKVVTVNLGGATYMGGEQIVEGVRSRFLCRRAPPRSTRRRCSSASSSTRCTGRVGRGSDLADALRSATRTHPPTAPTSTRPASTSTPSRTAPWACRARRAARSPRRSSPTLTTLLSQLVESWQLIGDGTEFGTAGLVSHADFPQLRRRRRHRAADRHRAGVVGAVPLRHRPIHRRRDRSRSSPSRSTARSSLPNDTYVLYVSAIRCAISRATTRRGCSTPTA